jgi:hypothetical protein
MAKQRINTSDSSDTSQVGAGVDDLKSVATSRFVEILTVVVNLFYLCGWVAAQAAAGYIIDKVSVEPWLRWCFRIVFGLSSLAVVLIHIWEDVRRTAIRAKARVDREKNRWYPFDFKDIE